MPLGAVLRRLGERGVEHLLVEGGSEVFTSFLEEREADNFALFVAPLLLGGMRAPSLLGGRGFDSPAAGIQVSGLSARKSDRDLLVEGWFRDPARPRKARQGR